MCCGKHVDLSHEEPLGSLDWRANPLGMIQGVPLGGLSMEPTLSDWYTMRRDFLDRLVTQAGDVLGLLTPV